LKAENGAFGRRFLLGDARTSSKMVIVFIDNADQGDVI
jgi:hypothetical protein